MRVEDGAEETRGRGDHVDFGEFVAAVVAGGAGGGFLGLLGFGSLAAELEEGSFGVDVACHSEEEEA